MSAVKQVVRYGYEAWCPACGKVTLHQFGSCLDHSSGFPRPAIRVPTSPPVDRLPVRRSA